MHLGGNRRWEPLMQSSKKVSLTTKKACLSFPQHHPWVSIPLWLLVYQQQQQLQFIQLSNNLSLCMYR